MRLIALLIALLLTCMHQPTECRKIKPWLDFSGYTRYNAYVDRRQVFGFREDYFLMYPLPYEAGCNCEDLNERGQTTMVPIDTRLQLLAEGPDVWCARSWSYIEANFFGVSEETINTCRLRHAFLRFEWENDTLLVGEYWHPFYIDECYPKTVSFNLGAPFDVQARDPQIRWNHQDGNHEVMLALMEESTHQTNGPRGFSTDYLRNGILPDVQAQYKYFWGEHLFGAAIDFKRIAPRLVTDKGCSTRETLISVSAMAYNSINYHQAHINSKIIYQENGTDLLLLSGYGVATQDPVTDVRTYTPTNAVSFWIDAYYETQCNIEPGLFFGYTKNLGAKDRLFIDPETQQPIIYTFPDAEKLSYMLRTSPRIRWYRDPVLVGIELEYTQSSFGTEVAANGKPQNTTSVYNIRFLLDFYYFF